ncbi:class I SAM-dependent DNA methyltransferase [Actinoplanes sp. NBC_00393]|uniref:class I SAM-dependent DNA methyltransferase n=1 Tax=Actinoplanes sp. NBC_00393 TaxID=2975953 RepID=UPI003FA41482
MTKQTYRQAFSSHDAAAAYAKRYTNSTYDNLLWDIEREQLRELIRSHCAESSRHRALDFATGTGRVLPVISEFFPSVVGVDVAQPMLDIAKASCPTATLHQADLSTGALLPEAPFQLVTAFRFLFNAEEELRASALRGIRANLADEGSVLIINNHGSTPSIRSVSHAAWTMVRPFLKLNHNRLSHRAVMRLLKDSGFEIVEWRSTGLAGEKLWRLLPSAIVARVERKASRSRAMKWVLLNRLYACRPLTNPSVR